MNLDSNTKTEQVKQAILQDIREGRYVPGDVLPSVLTLSRRFSVSKHTISQALSNLNERHILEVAHGKRTRVTGQVGGKTVRVYFFGVGSPLQEPFWDEFYRGIAGEFHQQSGYKLETAQSNTDSGNLAAGLDGDSLNAIGGAILLGTSAEWLAKLFIHKNIPAINVFDYNELCSGNFVTADLERPIRELVRHFAVHGRKRLALFNQFSEADTQGVNEYKRQFFLRAARDMGLQVLDIPGDLSRDPLAVAYHQLKLLAEERRLPDAILLASDNMAQGVYRAAHELGLRIPDDIGICGCNNLALGGYLIPQLSSIELSRYEQGRLAASGIIKLMDAKLSSGIRLRLPAQLVLRESC